MLLLQQTTFITLELLSWISQTRTFKPNERKTKTQPTGQSIKALPVSQWVYKDIESWTLVAHICNLNFSEGRDQEDCDSKPARANSSRDPVSKKSWWSGSK
jgi:hypothetical protein